MLRIAGNVIQVNTERKKEVGIFFYERNPPKRDTQSTKEFFRANKSLLLPRASKGPWAKTSICISTNPPPFKPKGGFPVFKNLEQLWFLSATTLKYKHKHTCMCKHMWQCSKE